MSKRKNTDRKLSKNGRRSFLGKSIAFSAFSMFGIHSNVMAQTGTKSALSHSPSQTLPEKGNYLIRKAYIVSVDPDIGNIEGGDIHIDNGVIVAIGKDIDAAGATVLDGKDMIVSPGLIDTHWHMWTTLLRSMAGDEEGKGYFDITSKYGKLFEPDDMYQGTRLSAMEAIYSGITTVHDWSHNIRSLAHAEADLRALNESGLRARYSCGTATGQDGDVPMDFGILKELHDNWGSYDNNQLLTLGLAWRGVGGHPGIDSKLEVGKQELEKARNMELPVTIHASASGIIEQLMKHELLRKDMQIVHGMDATTDEIEAMVKAGSSISISPYSELRIGYGIPPIDKFLKAGTTIGLSIDTTTLSGNADMFAVMKIFLNLANALERDEFALTAKKVLEMGTLSGAKSLGIDDITGSLKPGKRADLIMVNVKSPNMGYITSPESLLVQAAQPGNVDTVFVDGRMLKYQGELQAVAADEIYEAAAIALNELKKRS